MSDLNIFIILLNTAYLIWLTAFVAKDILWLRILTVTGNLVVIPYYLYHFKDPLWNSILWVGIYTSINGVMLFLLYLERRPVQLTEAEESIYNLTFKSINPRAFKKLVDQARWENLGPDVNLVTRDTDLEELLLVVDGKAEVVLKNGEIKYIPMGGFIGEQSFITGSTTSADVGTGAEATTLLRWNKKSLKNYLEHHETLKHTFDLILTADLIFKLRSMDQHQDVTHSQI